MESNEQNKLTNRIETDSQMESRMTASRKERLKGGGMEQKGKRTHGHGQQCGDCWGEVGIRELNGNGKNIIKFLKNLIWQVKAVKHVTMLFLSSQNF